MLTCIGLELVASFQLVKNELSAVHASLLMAVCGAGCIACVAVGEWGSNLVHHLAMACNERIHTLKHCVYCQFVGCCH